MACGETRDAGCEFAAANATGEARRGAPDRVRQLRRHDAGAACHPCDGLSFRGQHRNVDAVRGGFLQRMARRV